MHTFVEYPIYPVYFEKLHGIGKTVELRLPPTFRQCIPYEQERYVSKRFIEDYNKFIETLLYDRDIIASTVDENQIKTAILRCDSQNLAYQPSYMSYINPINWIYGNEQCNVNEIKLLLERATTLKNKYGKCILVIFYRNGEYETYLSKLKLLLEKDVSKYDILFLNSDVLTEGNEDTNIINLMILCGSRNVPFFGTLLN